jgi:integrase
MRRRVTDLVARGKVGVRATEITMSRLVTAVRWLRKTKRIPAGVAEAPDDWKAALVSFWKGLTKSTRDPEPNRPRFTQDEALAILAVSWQVDPRFGLLIDLGAEYRLGQVARCRRSDLDLEAGLLIVRGAGKKGGETIDLTDAQVASVRVAIDPGNREAGYLAAREEAWIADGTDYDLFPGGKMRRWRVASIRPGTHRGKSRPVVSTTLRKWFRKAEGLARVDGKKIKHVNGRGAYGIRRQHVKIANDEGISRFGLRAAGGWSSTKIPDEVYDEQENRRGRAEAKLVRARWRRESDPPKADAAQGTTDDAVRTSSALPEKPADDSPTVNGANNQ